MRSLKEQISYVNVDLAMTPIETAIAEAMRAGRKTVMFKKIDDIKGQTKEHLHPMGVSELLTAGYIVKYTTPGNIEVSGWLA